MEFKYTTKYRKADGTLSWRFVPPDDVKIAGVVNNVTFQDCRCCK